MIFGKCSDCCKVCCCKYDDAAGAKVVVTDKSRKQCEDWGGTVISCPPPPQCVCTCTPSAAVLDTQLFWDTEQQLNGNVSTYIGTRPSGFTVCEGTDIVVSGAFAYRCGTFGIPDPATYITVALFGALVPPQSVPAHIGQFYWVFAFYDVSPLGAGWPCPKNSPTLIYTSGWNVQDPGNIGCNEPDGWLDKWVAATADITNTPPVVSLSCDQYFVTCEDS